MNTSLPPMLLPPPRLPPPPSHSLVSIPDALPSPLSDTLHPQYDAWWF